MTRISDIPLICLAGVALIAFFLVFTSISVAFYPLPWNPVITYLSDFGNMKNNPIGGAGFTTSDV